MRAYTPHPILLGLAMATLLAARDARCDTPAPDAPAQAAAAFLAEIDAGNYAATWDHLADYAQSVVSKAQWIQAVRAARTPLGAAISREQTSRTESSQMPGAPDGRYVTLIFTSSLEKKKEATETVILMQESGKRWRVAGYWIR